MGLVRTGVRRPQHIGSVSGVLPKAPKASVRKLSSINYMDRSFCSLRRKRHGNPEAAVSLRPGRSRSLRVGNPEMSSKMFDFPLEIHVLWLKKCKFFRLRRMSEPPDPCVRRTGYRSQPPDEAAWKFPYAASYRHLCIYAAHQFG